MNIHLGTTSELKKVALDKALNYYVNINKIENDWTITSFEVESGVSPTPIDEESYLGAFNRAMSLYNQNQNTKNMGDLFVGLESGLVDRYGKRFEECWCVIIDKHKNEYIGISSEYALPNTVKTQLNKGIKHVDILNNIGLTLNIPPKNTWGIYSNNMINREISFFEAYRNALSSFFTKY